jgi:hypothetical protein
VMDAEVASSSSVAEREQLQRSGEEKESAVIVDLGRKLSSCGYCSSSSPSSISHGKTILLPHSIRGGGSEGVVGL